MIFLQIPYFCSFFPREPASSRGCLGPPPSLDIRTSQRCSCSSLAAGVSRKPQGCGSESSSPLTVGPGSPARGKETPRRTELQSLAKEGSVLSTKHTQAALSSNHLLALPRGGPPRLMKRSACQASLLKDMQRPGVRRRPSARS